MDLVRGGAYRIEMTVQPHDAERFNPEAIALAIKSSAHELSVWDGRFSIAASDQLTPAIHAKSRRATG